MAYNLAFKGVLEGHNGWVTSLATSPHDPDLLVSGSRDKTLLVWRLTHEGIDMGEYGRPIRSLHGHNHFVEDVTLSADSQYALSCSWDKTLRLWDLAKGESARVFVGHESDVLTCSFSSDNRQIISGGRDKTIRVWNTIGQCKYVFNDAHNAWVTSARFRPNEAEGATIISGGWDRKVRLYSLTDYQLKHTFEGHTGCVNSVTVSPDGTLCASGGKDGKVMLWDLKNCTRLHCREVEGEINAVCYHPDHYWLCVATSNAIEVFDLERKCKVDRLVPDTEGEGTTAPVCKSLAWSADGRILFAGYTDNVIRVYETEKA